MQNGRNAPDGVLYVLQAVRYVRNSIDSMLWSALKASLLS